MTAASPLAAVLREAERAVLGSLRAQARDVALGAGRSLRHERPSPVETALDRIGRRGLMLAWHLFWGPRAFTELVQLTPGVPRGALRRQLHALEAGGLIRRRQGSEGETRAEYCLTALGEALKPSLALLYLWGLGIQESSPPARPGAGGSS